MSTNTDTLTFLRTNRYKLFCRANGTSGLVADVPGIRIEIDDVVEITELEVSHEQAADLRTQLREERLEFAAVKQSFGRKADPPGKPDTAPKHEKIEGNQ